MPVADELNVNHAGFFKGIALSAIGITSQEQLDAVRTDYAKGATDEQFINFIRECATRRLQPGKHVYFQLRSISEWDAETRSKVRTKRAAHQTSIDAFRLIAQRSGEYQGQEPFVYIYLSDDNLPNVRSTVPLPDGDSTDSPKQPWAVEAAVYRKGFVRPVVSVARFDAYAVTYKKNDEVRLSEMWERRGPEQLAKCAEALALRQAFPEDLGNIYIAEELRDEPDDTPATAAATAAPVVEAPKPVTAPKVDHTPAEGKVAPRPGEEKATRRKKAEKAKTEPTVDNVPAKVDKAEEEVDKPNSHGVTVTDEDLPENMRKGAVPPPVEDRSLPPEAELAEPEDFEKKPTEEAKPAAKAEAKSEAKTGDRAPNAEEKAAISQKLKGFKQDSAMLRAFVLNFAKVDDTKKLTLGEWNAVIEHLEAAVKAGTIDKVVGGK